MIEDLILRLLKDKLAHLDILDIRLINYLINGLT